MVRSGSGFLKVGSGSDFVSRRSGSLFLDHAPGNTNPDPQLWLGGMKRLKNVQIKENLLAPHTSKREIVN